MDLIWGMEYIGGTRTVDIHIQRARKKLGPNFQDILQTVTEWVIKLQAGDGMADMRTSIKIKFSVFLAALLLLTVTILSILDGIKCERGKIKIPKVAYFRDMRSGGAILQHVKSMIGGQLIGGICFPKLNKAIGMLLGMD